VHRARHFLGVFLLQRTMASEAWKIEGRGGSWSAGTTEVGNTESANCLIYSLLCLAGVVALYVIVGKISRTVRHLACLESDKQTYFRSPTRSIAILKKYLFDAPLFRRRHHWSPKIGVLPTRVQSILLLIIIGANVALSVTGIEWNQLPSVNTIKHFRNRTGTLAVMNMVPLFILAGRNNPLIPLLGISYDNFNLLHRWFGRICAAEAIAHFGGFLAADYYKEGWAATLESLGSPTNTVTLTGLTAISAFLVINIQAMAVIRHAFYEFFLHFHICLVVTAIIGLWYHLDETPAQKTYLFIAIAVWGVERFIRVMRIVYRNFGGRGNSRASVELLPGNAIRVTYRLARPWTFQPGQYLFVTIPSIGLWTSHPFSIAWSEEETVLTDEKGLVMTQQDVLSQSTATKVSTIIRGRDGFTHKLFQKASTAEDGKMSLAAIVEGPYGTPNSLRSYGTVVLFAGGVGITHQVPYLRSLIVDYANSVAATRRVSLIWVVQSPEHLEWIRPWLTEVLALDRRREVLRIQIFVTRPRSAKEVQSPSDTIQMFPGRPNVETLLEKEITSRLGAMAVSVCGTGSLADDVRRAVRKQHTGANIDLKEATFSW
jgi:predicted ferric reductase